MLTNLTISYPDFKISEVIEPDHFDTNNADIKNKVDAIIAVLNQLTDATTDGASGADKVSLTAIAPYASTKLQNFLEEVIAKLKSTGGSAEIGTPSIVGVTGTTVNAQLSSLKSLLDGHATRLTTAEGKITSLETRATNVEGRATTLEGRATSLEGRATTLENNKTDKTTTSALDTRVGNLESNKTDKTTTTALDGRVGALETGKADKSTTYLRTEIDSKLSTKTNLTGDHLGTWRGLTPSQAAEPINGARLDVLEAQNVEQKTLVNGANTLSSVQEAPLKVLSTVGKTVVNHAPLFNRGWSKNANATINSGTKITHVFGGTGTESSWVHIRSLKAGNTYTLSCSHNAKLLLICENSSGGETGRPVDYSTQQLITFVVPENTALTKMYLHTAGLPAGTYTWENLTINEGFVAEKVVDSIKGIVNPTIEANGKREVVETTLHALNGVQDELFRDTDGKLKKRTRFKEMALDGSLGWEYSADYVGFKRVRIAKFNGQSDEFEETQTKISKYDGKILAYNGSYPSADYYTVIADGYMYLTIADTDSGWGETYTPTADEIKAYFYGWKMYESTGGGSSLYNGTGTKRWIGRLVDGSIDGNNISSTLPTTTYQAYTPYKLVYQLATERVEEVPTSGQVVLEEGSNTVELKQGIIVKERANPVEYMGIMYININGAVHAIKGSELKNKSLRIIAVYKNNQLDTMWKYTSNQNSNGMFHADTLKDNFDPTAIYYVTYEILPELTAKAEPTSVEYASSLKSLVESNTRQLTEHEGRLDVVSKLSLSALQGMGELVQAGRFNYAFSGSFLTGTVYFKKPFSTSPMVVATASNSYLNIAISRTSATSFDFTARHLDSTTYSDSGAWIQWIAIDNKG